MTVLSPETFNFEEPDLPVVLPSSVNIFPVLSHVIYCCFRYPARFNAEAGAFS